MNRKRFVLYLCYLGLSCFACNLIHPITPTLIKERGLDSSMFGVALAAMYLAFFCFSPLWGRLCDYMPSRRVMVIGITGYAIGQAAFGLARTETAVILARFFAGAFSGALNTALMNLLVNTTEAGDRSRRITLYATVSNVANALGYFAGGFLGLISVNFTFVVTVILTLAAALFAGLAAPDDSSLKPKPSVPLRLKDANPLSAFIFAKELMTPVLLLFFAFVVCGHTGQIAYEQVFNYFIKDQLSLSSAYNGIFKAAIALLTFCLNSFVLTRLLKKTGPDKLLLWPVLISAPLVLPVYFTFSAAPLASCYVLLMAAGNIKTTLYSSALAARSTPESSNRLMGLLQSMYGLGGIIGAFLAGMLYKSDVLAPFTLAALTLTAAVALYSFYIRRSKSTD